jgi:hypothetical protein
MAFRPTLPTVVSKRRIPAIMIHVAKRQRIVFGVERDNRSIPASIQRGIAGLIVANCGSSGVIEYSEPKICMIQKLIFAFCDSALSS